MRFKTGEYVKDCDENTAVAVDDRKTVYVAVKHRAAGSSSIFFGPFNSIDDLQAWCIINQITVGVIELVNPESDESTWWNR